MGNMIPQTSVTFNLTVSTPARRTTASYVTHNVHYFALCNHSHGVCTLGKKKKAEYFVT